MIDPTFPRATFQSPENFDANAAATERSIDALCAAARCLTHDGPANIVTFSPKVFIPITQLCRDVCHYCTFAKAPRAVAAAFMSPSEILEIARAGARAGCSEALFTVGDRPESRYAVAREALRKLGHTSTAGYLAEMAALVTRETGLLVHVNAGILTSEEIAQLRPVTASMGLMLETVASRLCEPGGPHFGSPDKRPEVRLRMLADLGCAAVPTTTGLLIGIGETRRERIDALLALHDLHGEFGHIQEIIIQSFRAKPGTKMAASPEPDLDEQRWTIAVARLIFGAAMSIQAPPNLHADDVGALIDAGLNDLGGISPVTLDHVNPEAPWPEIASLRATCATRGKALVPRLTVYPAYIAAADRWIDRGLHGAVLRLADASGLARDSSWHAGTSVAIPEQSVPAPNVWDTNRRKLHEALASASQGRELSLGDVVFLFEQRGADACAVGRAADDLRRDLCGDTVTYVVNRNINYTNICTYACGFCAFSKGRRGGERDAAYLLDLETIVARAREAWERGATEVCLQGGIHPSFTGQTYLDICGAIHSALPGLHIHAFSPLEIDHGAMTLGIGLREFLMELRSNGLGSLPGTAAEILSDDVRAIICPDKLSSARWTEVIRTAHSAGLPTTSTMMFGHVDTPAHWAAHLLALRRLQSESGGITEFVPLPFVASEAPIFKRGRVRAGPTFREALMVHAVARLALCPLIPNIQTSWVKMGREGAQSCLDVGANDLGGALMDESITRAAGALHGRELGVGDLHDLITGIGRKPQQRTTLYGVTETAAKAGLVHSIGH